MLFTSLTRISDLARVPFQTTELDRASWATGDYVVAQMLETSHGPATIELQNGRQSGKGRGAVAPAESAQACRQTRADPANRGLPA